MLLAHPTGTHYHITRSCGFIKGDPTEFQYVEIKINEAWSRHLHGCPDCTVTKERKK